MPYHTNILTNDIFTRTPSYIGGVLDVSTYTELTLDISLTLCINSATLSIYRINPNDVPELLREFVYTHNQKISLDMYRFDLIDGTIPNAILGGFGNRMQVLISANHMMSGIITIKGKGLF